MAYYRQGRRFNRQRAWAGRQYGNRKVYAKKGMAGLGIGAPYIAGALIGMTEFDKQIPYELKISLAVLPATVIRMVPGAKVLQNIIQGMLLGDIIQARTGITLGKSLTGSTGSNITGW